jgi:signal transduction histidine kinase
VTQLKETEEQLQNILAQLMQIQEEERRRFSRDLHDGIGQSLFSLKMSIDRMIMEGGDASLQKLGQQVANLMEEVRELAWEMRPSVLDDLGIVPALRTYFDNYERHYGIKIRFLNELKQRPNLLAETTIYRVVQEALTNIGKYAGVAEATVKIGETDDVLEAVIEDEGTGFSLQQPRQGVGLYSMEERARAAGGELVIRSEPGKGTVVTLRLPKQSSKLP